MVSIMEEDHSQVMERQDKEFGKITRESNG